MTHRGPFQPLLFCDSVSTTWQNQRESACVCTAAPSSTTPAHTLALSPTPSAAITGRHNALAAAAAPNVPRPHLLPLLQASMGERGWLGLLGAAASLICSSAHLFPFVTGPSWGSAPLLGTLLLPGSAVASPSYHGFK